MSTLQAALAQFDATEANLTKLEKLWREIQSLIPDGPAFGSPPEYENACRAFRRILPSLPAIDGFRVEDKLYDFDTIGQWRLDNLELGMIEASITIENELDEQGLQLREYRFRFEIKRTEMIRDRVLTVVMEIDEKIPEISNRYQKAEANEDVTGDDWEELKEYIKEIDILLGSGERPLRWKDLQRHIHFAKVQDLCDIRDHDWPEIKTGLQSIVYHEHDPLPVDVADLGEVAASKPRGAVPSKLDWSSLTDEEFERLIFMLICEAEGYENPEWLQQTHAPDRGRDISVNRVTHDSLAGPRRQRVIIQCKHWLSKSVGPAHINAAIGQMPLWEPPRVDVLIIATSGRFTADAISIMEKHNQADHGLQVEPWADTNLERMLAPRPHLIAQAGLRRV